MFDAGVDGLEIIIKRLIRAGFHRGLEFIHGLDAFHRLETEALEFFLVAHMGDFALDLGRRLGGVVLVEVENLTVKVAAFNHRKRLARLTLFKAEGRRHSIG